MDRIEFTVNNVRHSVGSEVSSETSLNEYLRSHLNLRGVKYMCREGGCGACVVTVANTDLNTFSVNSCLVSIASCKDWDITTIEDIGNRKKGYHPIQTNLAKHNGTQCGYCTPGWVMSMYSLIKSKSKMTMAEIEDSFASNTCRCTGYRPILDAFKEFGSDAPKENQNILDIEDLNKVCNLTGSRCYNKNIDDDDDDDDYEDWCFIEDELYGLKNVIKIKFKDNRTWYRVNYINEIFDILSKIKDDSYMLVAGNTGKGAYPMEYPKTLIDISGIKMLKGYTIDQNLIVKAGTTLSDFSDIFKELSTEDGFEYLDKINSHLNLIANIPVKNLGTIGGNLMIKYKHNDFPSDIFVLMEAIGAIVTIRSKSGFQKVSLTDFLKVDMKGKVIVNILISPLSLQYEFVSYKVMPRSQNAHAIVNAAFLYKLSKDKRKVIKVRIVFGGLSPQFIHAKNTEMFLVGKNIFTNEILQEALTILEKEIEVLDNPPEPSIYFRKKLAIGLFYKGLMKICPTTILGEMYKSGSINLRLSRPLSRGTQVFDSDKSMWPVNQPITKVEGLIQCAGEAHYVDDIPSLPKEVYAAFVLSTVATGDINTIDSSPAMSITGVLAFYTAKDIPGLNSFTPTGLINNDYNEELLCNGKVKYFNQPIGIVVAESESLAKEAAKKVNVTYKNIGKPILTIETAKTYEDRVSLVKAIPPKEKGTDSADVFKGQAKVFGQYHYTMETQVCVAIPSDGELVVYPSTQWMDLTQVAISQALNIEQSRINMSVKRVGGAFGAKISRASQVAVSSSLVAHYLNKPCRFVMPMTSVMRALGKRFPCEADYEIDVSKPGEVQYLKLNIYEDNGYTINEPIVMIGTAALTNCYDSKRWDVKVHNVFTDTAKNTWCRAPGSIEQIAMVENIMEQISYKMSLDPIETRQINFIQETAISDAVDKIKECADYDSRKKEIKQFNDTNKWKKRGLRFTPLRWPTTTIVVFGVTLTVFQGDGSVAITHGGIEMGQGINTKVVQVCAFKLNIPIDKIQVKASTVIINPNSCVSGASVTSDSVCIGTVKCCDILLERLAPIKAALKNPTWELVIKSAVKQDINLMVNYNVTKNDLKPYNVYGATLSEVEVDILTGELHILRVDVLEDVGQSLSPYIDIGQIEGAFIMGLGFWTCENLVYDQNTGELLTDRSWNYYVPLAKDIPIDFRIYFERNQYNQNGVLGSKTTGEPAICMSISIAFAIREAITSARADKGIPTTEWFNIDGPCTNETIVICADTRLEDFKFY